MSGTITYNPDDAPYRPGWGHVVCEVCDRKQPVHKGSTLTPNGWRVRADRERPTVESAAHFVCSFGWSQTETGWLCPFHSDAGTTILFSIFEKVPRHEDR